MPSSSVAPPKKRPVVDSSKPQKSKHEGSSHLRSKIEGGAGAHKPHRPEVPQVGGGLCVCGHLPPLPAPQCLFVFRQIRSLIRLQ